MASFLGAHPWVAHCLEWSQPPDLALRDGRRRSAKSLSVRRRQVQSSGGEEGRLEPAQTKSGSHLSDRRKPWSVDARRFAWCVEKWFGYGNRYRVGHRPGKRRRK